MDLLADADGALEALDGDLPGEEAFDDLDDEERVFLVELPGGEGGFAEGKTLDPDGRQDSDEAEAIAFGTAGGVGELGSDLDGNVLRGSVGVRAGR